MWVRRWLECLFEGVTEMKAVFVIDLPVALENLLGEELLLYINHKDDRYIMTEECKLRPLPAKTGQSAFCKDIAEACRLGWDMCIDTITGETE